MPQAGNRKATVHKGLAVTIEVTLGTGFKPFCFSVRENYKTSKYRTSPLSSQIFFPASYACATWLNGSAPASYGRNKSILLFNDLAFVSASSRETASDF